MSDSPTIRPLASASGAGSGGRLGPCPGHGVGLDIGGSRGPGGVAVSQSSCRKKWRRTVS
jgi:hypothetical protein